MSEGAQLMFFSCHGGSSLRSVTASPLVNNRENSECLDKCCNSFSLSHKCQKYTLPSPHSVVSIYTICRIGVSPHANVFVPLNDFALICLYVSHKIYWAPLFEAVGAWVTRATWILIDKIGLHIRKNLFYQVFCVTLIIIIGLH